MSTYQQSYLNSTSNNSNNTLQSPLLPAGSKQEQSFNQNNIPPQSQVEACERPVTAEEAIQRVGSCGRFQFLSALFLIMSFCLNGQIIYGLSFLIYKGDLNLQCIGKGQNTFSYCDVKQACNANLTQSYRIVDEKTNLRNWITDFNFVCTSDAELSIFGSVFFIFFTFGSMFWLSCADRYGRLPIVKYGAVAHLIIMMTIQFVPYKEVIYVFLALQGLEVAMSSQVAYVMLLQLVPTSKRSFYCTALNAIDGGLSSTLIPIFYYLVGNWRILFAFNMLLSLICFIRMFYQPESPRFYLSQNRFQEARKVYSQIAKCNGRPILKNRFVDEVSLANTEITTKKESIYLVFKKQNRKYLLPLVVIPLLWFTVDLTYYGINFGLNHLRGNIYFNGVLSGTAELISYILGGFLAASCLGRKYTTIICYLIGGSACVAYSYSSSSVAMSYLFVLLGKFGAGAVFCLVYLVTTQMFPTSIRGTVFGIANLCARIGGIIAPIIDGLLPKYFMLIFGLMSILSGIGSLALNQTKGKDLKDKFQDRKQILLDDTERGGLYTELKDKVTEKMNKTKIINI